MSTAEQDRTRQLARGEVRVFDICSEAVTERFGNESSEFIYALSLAVYKRVSRDKSANGDFPTRGERLGHEEDITGEPDL